MRLKIGIWYKRARTDAGAVDHQIELAADVFKFVKAHAVADRTAAGDKSISEIIEIDGRIHEWNGEAKATGKPVAIRSRRIRDSAEHLRYRGSVKRMRAQRNRPVWDLDFARARKLTQFDH